MIILLLYCSHCFVIKNMTIILLLHCIHSLSLKYDVSIVLSLKIRRSFCYFIVSTVFVTKITTISLLLYCIHSFVTLLLYVISEEPLQASVYSVYAQYVRGEIQNKSHRPFISVNIYFFELKYKR
jgi:hypothetical protein